MTHRRRSGGALAWPAALPMMEVAVINRQRRVRVNAARLADVARKVLERVGPRGEHPVATHGDRYDVAIVLVSDARIRALNRRFRGVDAATDVLAFPPDHEIVRLMDPAAHLGDIVISVETAKRQASPATTDLRVELIRLLIHGLLHLLGYDHERSAAEARRMRRLEARLRRSVRAAGSASC